MQSPGTVAQVLIANAILDPALWIILSNLLHLDCVSNKCNVLSEEQCNHHEVSLHLGCFRTDSEV